MSLCNSLLIRFFHSAMYHLKERILNTVFFPALTTAGPGASVKQVPYVSKSLVHRAVHPIRTARCIGRYMHISMLVENTSVERRPRQSAHVSLKQGPI